MGTDVVGNNARMAMSLCASAPYWIPAIWAISLTNGLENIGIIV